MICWLGCSSIIDWFPFLVTYSILSIHFTILFPFFKLDFYKIDSFQVSRSLILNYAIFITLFIIYIYICHSESFHFQINNNNNFNINIINIINSYLSLLLLSTPNDYWYNLESIETMNERKEEESSLKYLSKHKQEILYLNNRND